MPEQSIVLVGHSLFIRALLRQHTNPGSIMQPVSGAAGCSLGDLAEYKLANAGMIGLELDFSQTLPITDAELMLSSQLCGFNAEGPPQEDFELSLFVCASSNGGGGGALAASLDAPEAAPLPPPPPPPTS